MPTPSGARAIELGYIRGTERELERSTESLMPVFDASRLNDAAFEDLLAYLGTLRGAQANP